MIELNEEIDENRRKLFGIWLKIRELLMEKQIIYLKNVIKEIEILDIYNK